MKQIQAVAGTCEIKIEAGILRVQPVVGRIIDPTKTERWAEMISFRGMIVNYVENHLDAGSVEAAHHRLELGDLLAHLPAAAIFSMRSEETDGIVAPEVC